MTPSDQKNSELQDGVIFRGFDGNLYFIPSNNLATFQLSGFNIEEAKQMLEDVSPEQSNILAAQGPFKEPPREGRCCALDMDALLRALNEVPDGS